MELQRNGIPDGFLPRTCSAFWWSNGGDSTFVSSLMKEVTTSFWGVWYAPMCKDVGELGANAHNVLQK